MAPAYFDSCTDLACLACVDGALPSATRAPGAITRQRMESLSIPILHLRHSVRFRPVLVPRLPMDDDQLFRFHHLDRAKEPESEHDFRHVIGTRAIAFVDRLDPDDLCRSTSD